MPAADKMGSSTYVCPASWPPSPGTLALIAVKRDLKQREERGRTSIWLVFCSCSCLVNEQTVGRAMQSGRLAAFLPAVLGAGQGSPEATLPFWQLGFTSVHFSLSSCSALRRADSALAIGSGRF